MHSTFTVCINFFMGMYGGNKFLSITTVTESDTFSRIYEPTYLGAGRCWTGESGASLWESGDLRICNPMKPGPMLQVETKRCLLDHIVAYTVYRNRTPGMIPGEQRSPLLSVGGYSLSPCRLRVCPRNGKILFTPILAARAHSFAETTISLSLQYWPTGNFPSPKPQFPFPSNTGRQGTSLR